MNPRRKRFVFLFWRKRRVPYSDKHCTVLVGYQPKLRDSECMTKIFIKQDGGLWMEELQRGFLHKHTLAFFISLCLPMNDYARLKNAGY